MAHHNTVFAQWLKLVPGHEFEPLANRHHCGRKLRKMTRWAQFVAITDGKTHDITAARALQLPRGSIVVMDRGYNGYAWYNQLNNNFTLAARTIADIYKARWQIELFLKWIKQNLKVKSFLGTSKNAVMAQIWIAMCVYLLLSYIKFLNHIQPSLQQILRLLQINLFERRDLLELLRGDPPEPLVSPNQTVLVFS